MYFSMILFLEIMYRSPNFWSDGETFISADDLRVNLWNLEISNQSFNIVDVKPTNMEDLTGMLSSIILVEVITSLFELFFFWRFLY